MAYSTISKPSLHFNTVTYSGTGSAQSITGVGFRPDWLWIKHREDVSNHKLQDVIRGSTKVIGSNETSAEATVAQGVTSFDSDGFSLGTDASVNGTGAAGIAAWNWKAGGSGSANTDGYLSSTVSVNQTSGFSIVRYTGDTVSGRTIGHGLNAVPKMIIIKGTDSNSSPDNWCIYHEAMGNTKRLKFNSTDAAATGAGYWNNTSPTSSVFTIGNSSEPNSSNGVYIAYCFAEKKGYSKFGQYTANAAVDGNFIYTGFKPAFVLIKSSNSAQAGQDWFIYDSVRDPGNAATQTLKPNATSAEETNVAPIDILSNGFKLRTNTGRINGTNGEYIYMAFAAEPLVANVGTNGVPATAR